MTMVRSRAVVRKDSEHPGDPSAVFLMVTGVSQPGCRRGRSPSRFDHEGTPCAPCLLPFTPELLGTARPSFLL